MSNPRLLLLSAASAAAFASAWLLHVTKADRWMASGSEHSSQKVGKPGNAVLGIGRGSAQSLQAGSHAAPKATSDFDGDGRSDLMLTHTLNDWYAYWTMSGPDAASYSPVLPIPPMFEDPRYQTSSYPVAIADFDGDGRADVLFGQRDLPREPWMWVQMALSGGSPAAHILLTNYERVVGTGDVDGDGKADLVLSSKNYGVSSLQYWIMDGLTVLRKSVKFTPPPGYEPVAFGEFNGDHRLDVVWNSRNTGNLLMWLGDGVAFTPAPVRDLNPGWEVWGAGDVDGDGRNDLLLTNPSFRYFAYWTMDGATPVRYSPAFALPGQGLLNRFGPITAGDYNGDGKLDIVLSRQRDQSLLMWQGDGNGFAERPMRRHTPDWRVEPTFKVPGAPVRPYVTGDADGDGRSDVLRISTDDSDDGKTVWGNSSRYMLYRGTNQKNDYFDENPSLDGEPLASGDFDGDGRADLVIERKDAATGAIRTVMRLSSRFPAAEVAIPTPAATWRIFGAGDVDGDGLSDLLLGQNLQSGSSVDGPEYRNPRMSAFAYWIMDRGKVVRYSLGFHTDPAAPRIAARGDFNGDGRLDFVWSSLSRASVPVTRMWTAYGEGFSVFAPMQQPALGWDVIAGGDVNADGKSDLVLQNVEGTAYWLMDGTQVINFSPGFLTGRIDVVGDYNGDTRIDLLRFTGLTCFSIPRVEMWFGDGSGLLPRYALPSAGYDSSPTCANTTVPTSLFSR